LEFSVGYQKRVYVFFLKLRNFSDTNFIRNSGFMEVAEVNGIVMLFPQNNPLPSKGGSARGCWDTYGVSGTYYATQKGDQIISLKRIIDAVIGRVPKMEKFLTNTNNKPG
jgi:hypothetical protein